MIHSKASEHQLDVEDKESGFNPWDNCHTQLLSNNSSFLIEDLFHLFLLISVWFSHFTLWVFEINKIVNFLTDGKEPERSI